jgi:hypothetical protein
MTLTDQIQRERKTIQGYEHAIKEAREKLWEANFVRRNDERRRGESDEHWRKRRKRNREAYENRDEAVEHLVRKLKAHERMIDKLKDLKEEVKEEHREDGKFDRGSTSIVVFDGKSCVEDLAYWLNLIRGQGRWSGYLVSGYRTPAYSTQLCYGICGHPTCPGLCAGATSNHAKLSYPGPAGDVTDFIRCENALIDVGSGYRNYLPRDLVHMSKSGY